MATQTVVKGADLCGGLSETEAARRLVRDGPNLLPVEKGPSRLRQFSSQLVHFFALMLWAAGGLAFVARLPELGYAIFVVVIFNGVFSFVQEFRAERAAERLRDLMPRFATVIRSNKRMQIDAIDLVDGDLVILEAGDRLSADLEVTTTHALLIDMSLLTGESIPIMAESGMRLYAGTFVVEGEGEALVRATAGATRLARIARLTRSVKRQPAPLTLEVHRVVRTIAFMAIGVGLAFFGVSFLLGREVSGGFVLAIGVTVALVPEGLLPTVTLSLALGAQRMAHRNALVRRLESVETLGSTTFICTDKTGTLTMNQMSVITAWTPSGEAHISGEGYEPVGDIHLSPGSGRDELRRLALAAARSSSGHAAMHEGVWTAFGDPMEAALDVFARRMGLDTETDRNRRDLYAARFPFDARRRRMSVVVEGELLVKGAPDAVFPLCRVLPGSSAALDIMTERGLRVIAIATKRLEAIPNDPQLAERDLDLIGIIGLQDPLRPHAASAIARCRAAGIKIAMITGDHPITALAIARDVGLAPSRGIVIEGRDLPHDDEELGRLVDHDGVVLARIEPEDKLRIARSLRNRGHVVAMTGDGVNDGPALQEADIGVAMGRSGTDVAREAADLVLLDDDFASIVAAVEQGRAIFANVRRFLTYHLSDNVAELTPFLVWAISGGRFPLALGVLQILALDIGTDTLSAVALGAEPPSGRALERRPDRGRLLNAEVAKRSFAILGPTEALFAMLAFLVSLMAWGWRPGQAFPEGLPLWTASGSAFATVVIAQTANAFACRSAMDTPWRLGWTSNRLLVIGAALELAITAVFLFVAPIARVLDHRSPSLTGWLIALASAPAVLIVDAGYKKWRRGPLIHEDRDGLL